ncbi:MAG: hypothetical protein D6729_04480 [Deltaproteobacteria bacterium]|nr:MAG: hypothetical protein D6729_04480 [Deltaproteobacteria bacterium]
MVETAISMIIIVPVILYSLYLYDALSYKLDLQEAITGAAWDFTTRDYQAESTSAIQGSVQRNNRLTWCDHTSAYDSYDRNYDCENEGHHKAVAAHACWLGDGAKQVTCSIDTGYANYYLQPAITGFHGRFTHGGFVTCDARLSVANYLVPQEFLQQFHGDHKLFERDQLSGSVHDASASGNVLVLEGQPFGLLVDTWALNRDGNNPWQISPDQKRGEIYDRVNTIYQRNLGYVTTVAASADFFATAYSKDLLNPAFPLLMGDNPLTPNISIRKGLPGDQTIRQEGRNAKYFSYPWKDWARDPYLRSSQARGNNYMGNKRPEEF